MPARALPSAIAWRLSCLGKAKRRKRTARTCPAEPRPRRSTSGGGGQRTGRDVCGAAPSQAGAHVVLLEQGKPVQPRRHDLAAITRGRLVEDSNYCFGEGGAGTYSDGKLYTRSKDRAAVADVLSTLIEHGADP